MSETTITCPSCGSEFPLTEAVGHRVREQFAADFEKQRSALHAALAAREQKLAAERTALEQRATTVDAELAQRLDSERRKISADAARQAEEKLGTELKDLQARDVEQRARLKVAQETELTLRRRERELEESKAALSLEVERTIAAERGKIAESARQQATEAERFNLAQKEKVITDLQREIAALKQKSEQGSMQLQGETLELELEKDLCVAFPHDELAEVKKGQRGADVSQRVRTGAGLECGTILWEAKRARNWSADWPEKLRADQREAKADLAVLVVTCPPEGLRGFGAVEGVWVCEPMFAVALAAALRQGLVGAAAQRGQQANRADKAQAIYDHLCGVEFRQHIEAIVESFRGLKEQLDAEQRAFARQWKEREHQLHKAITHTAMLYGGIQGIAGREALPEIKTLALDAFPHH